MGIIGPSEPHYPISEPASNLPVEKPTARSYDDIYNDPNLSLEDKLMLLLMEKLKNQATQRPPNEDLNKLIEDLHKQLGLEENDKVLLKTPRNEAELEEYRKILNQIRERKPQVTDLTEIPPIDIKPPPPRPFGMS
jgi:hypothetical protein